MNRSGSGGIGSKKVFYVPLYPNRQAFSIKNPDYGR
jgi:hypothetical protein